jgi:hypothetical protein
MDNLLPGYDEWKLRSPEEEAELHEGRRSRREWMEDHADDIRDAWLERGQLDREFDR